MNLKAKKKLLYILSAILLIASASAFALALLLPTPSVESTNHMDANNDDRPNAVNKQHHAESLTLDSFKPIWDINLQREIFDPPPPQKVERQSPPLAAELTGTAVDPDDASKSLAFFTVQGQTVICGAGEKIGLAPNLAEVLKIGQEDVKLKYDNKEITLKIPK